jgi:hypothetical protein
MVNRTDNQAAIKFAFRKRRVSRQKLIHMSK